jgi:hypothetical protein
VKARCSGCGSAFRFNFVKGHRYLVHPTGISTSKKFQQPMLAAGCRNWTIRADSLEAILKSVILNERATPEFAESIKKVLATPEPIQERVEEEAELMQTRVTEIERQVRNLRSNMQYTETKEEQEMVWAQIREVKKQLADKRMELEHHRRQFRQQQSIRDQVLSQLEEKNALAKFWDSPGQAGSASRNMLFETWVKGIYIDVGRVEGAGRKTPKRVHILLRSLPQSPLTSELEKIFLTAGEQRCSDG